MLFVNIPRGQAHSVVPQSGDSKSSRRGLTTVLSKESADKLYEVLNKGVDKSLEFLGTDAEHLKKYRNSLKNKKEAAIQEIQKKLENKDLSQGD